MKELARVRDVFKGSFSALQSGINFEKLYKKITDISQYDTPNGIKGNRPLNNPLPTRSRLNTPPKHLS